MELNEEKVRRWEQNHRRGKIAGGLLLVAAGSLFLAKELGAQIPDWLFSWKTLLIGIGLVGFIKHGFSRAGWLIPLAAGVFFLVGDLYPEMAIKPLLWPIFIILIGLFIMFKPRRKYREAQWQRCQTRQRHEHRAYDRAQNSTEDFIDSTSVMGGIQKNILSKKFRGGDITNVMGGTELNLTQADFEGTATLEVTQVFGGTKLIVPAHWQIQSNVVTVMGSIEDNRPVAPHTGNDSDRILILNGTTFCGGIEISSY